MQLEKRFPKIPPEDFQFVQVEQALKDVNLETKPIGFFKDAMLRLRKNKASVIAFWIICAISFLALFGQGFNPYTFREQDPERANMPPRVPGIERLGILDGSSVLTNRRLENLSDTTLYPEGSILRVFNEREVQGVKMVDVKIDQYKMRGAENDYYWLGTDY